MRLSRVLVGASLCAACSEATGLGGQAAEPKGTERLSVSTGALTLAPGRDAWLTVSTYIQTSSTSMSPVTPAVTFESSNPSVASVVSDSVIYAHVVAKSPGSAVITTRSTRDPKNVVTTAITVAKALASNDAGLTYSATAALTPTSPSPASTPLGPSELDVTVTVSNPTSGVREVLLAGCPAWIRIYGNANYTGAPLVDIPRGVQCGAAPAPVILAPGKSESFHAEGFRLTLSGQSLPPGPYYVAAVVDRVNDLLNVSAGQVNIVSPNAGLTFAASTTVSDGQLRPTVSFTNTNSEPVRLEFGACAVSLLAFRNADRTGTPAWDSDQRRTPSGFGYACASYLVMTTINPGQTASPKEYNPTFPVAEMLGDSLPAGHYYFKVRAGLNWRTVEVNAGDADVKK
jgi:hypothetical protein